MNAATRRILFVDDDVALADAMARYFERLGYQTFTANSGRDGVRQYHRVAPDLAVVDLHMPDISGLHVLEELQSRRPTIIMLTGDSEIENAVEAVRRGAENFLTKPIEMAHLEVAVERAIEKSVLNRENRELRAKVRPNSKRRALKVALFVGFAAASAVVGSLIGGTTSAPRAVPIPVPINPSDTVLPMDDVPFQPIPQAPSSAGTTFRR